MSTLLLAEDWVVVVDALAVSNITLADVMDAYKVGCIEAEMGMPCLPHYHYQMLGDIAKYEQGWQETNAALDAAVEGSIESDMAEQRGWLQ